MVYRVCWLLMENLVVYHRWHHVDCVFVIDVFKRFVRAIKINICLRVTVQLIFHSLSKKLQPICIFSSRDAANPSNERKMWNQSLRLDDILNDGSILNDIVHSFFVQAWNSLLCKSPAMRKKDVKVEETTMKIEKRKLMLQKS